MMRTIYTIRDNKTGKEYKVESIGVESFEMVWLSQKCWFSTGSEITITNENGESKVFTK